MHAVVISDGALTWEERDDPVPGDTEVVVSVRAAGLNGADLVQRRGFYPAPPGSPQDIPGMEFAGEVTAVGRQVTKVAVGARVMAVVGGGAQATMCLADESHVIPVPEGLGWPEAGGFPEVYSTAYDALFSQAELSSGERVLITGAAGGVGTAGVQLSAATGATVVASVRDAARRDEVADLGAHHVIDPSDVASHGPYDVVLELVGAPSLEGALAHLATGARIVVIGMGAGASLSLNLFALMSTRSRISGSTLRARSRTEKANVAAGVIAHVLPHLASGRVTVPIHQTFPMSDADAAYEHFAAGSKLGKIVLVP